MDVLGPTAIVGGLVTAIMGMAGFIVWLFKRTIDDKDKQITQRDGHIERLIVVNDKNAETAKEALRLALDEKAALERIERELALLRGRRSTDR